MESAKGTRAGARRNSSESTRELLFDFSYSSITQEKYQDECMQTVKEKTEYFERLQEMHSSSVPGGTLRLRKSDTMRFLLVGKTGSGKSSTGNTILGEKLFDAEVCFSSVTTSRVRQLTKRNNVYTEGHPSGRATPRSTEEEFANYHRSAKITLEIFISKASYFPHLLPVSQRPLQIVDSPGLCDTKRKSEEVDAEVIKAVACMHPGPTAILFVITIGRYTEEEVGVHQRLKHLLGDRVTEYMIIIFTHGDKLTREKKTIEDVLSTAPESLLKTVKECGNRYVVFDNMADDKQPQVDRLMEKVRKLSEAHGGKPYECTGSDDVGERIEREVTKRLRMAAEEEEERKKDVKDLMEKIKKNKEQMEKEERDFTRKEEKRQKVMKKAEKERKRKIEELSKKISEQKLNAEKQQKKERELHEWTKEKHEELTTQMEESREKDLGRFRIRYEEMQTLFGEMESALEAQREACRAVLEGHEEELRKLKDQVDSTDAKDISSRCNIL